MQTFTLSQLATFIRRVFALNLPDAVWVAAELGEVHESRGHCWLTLVEKAEQEKTVLAQLDAVIWSAGLTRIRKEHSARLVDSLLRQGMSVRLKVTTSFHERFGLKLVVEDIDTAFTIGALQQARQATLETLHRDGILDRNAGRPLPVLPQRLAVISAESAAGLSDFQRQLAENNYGYVFQTELFPAAMQGRQTPEEISKRLRQIARRRSEFDLIVIVRGGGGKTDLAAFDDESLCRAVADAALPVLAGIGHEIDDTVLDRVVHRSLKTPTAVAAFLIDCLLGAETVCLRIGREIYHEAGHSATQHVYSLERLGQHIRQLAAASVQSSHLRAAALEKTLHDYARAGLERSVDRLDSHQRLLDALRPETTLARGYALASQAGKLLTSPVEVSTGDVDLQLRDGRIRLRKD